MKEYEHIESVSIDVWRKYAAQDSLDILVEDIGWKAIQVAKKNGVDGKVKDIHFDIIPNFDDEPKDQKVKVVLFYVPVL